MSTKTTDKKTFIWAYAGGWLSKIFSIIVTFVLARKLGPEAFGIVALALVYLGFVQLFIDSGLNISIIQKKDLRKEHLDSVFWVGLAIGIFLAAISIALAPWWSRSNEMPLLYPIIAVLSISLPLKALTIVQQTILLRDLDFKALTIRSSISIFAGGISSVVLAYSGYGVWALVVQHLVTPVVGLITLWHLTSWRPRFAFSLVAIRELMHVSTASLAGKVGIFVNQRTETYLTGLMFGNPLIVGIYKFAERLVSTALEVGTKPLGAVSFPKLALLQTDRKQLRFQYLEFIHLNAIIAIPSLLLLAGLSDHILGLLGERWLAGSDALKLLCVAGIIQTFVTFSGPISLAIEKARSYALAIWVAALISNVVFALAAYYLRTYSSTTIVTGIAGTRLAINVIVQIPLLILPMAHNLKISIMDFLRILFVPMCAGILAYLGASSIFILPKFFLSSPFLNLLISMIFGILPSFVFLICFDASFRNFIGSLLKKVRKLR